MGRAGDLLLIFADALTRSWKQVIKFQPDGAPPPRRAERRDGRMRRCRRSMTPSSRAIEGVVRDERGVRLAREESD